MEEKVSKALEASDQMQTLILEQQKVLMDLQGAFQEHQRQLIELLKEL